MTAIFPKGIRNFVRHQNLTEDVDADDINAIQDEVSAIQATLGPMVQNSASAQFQTLGGRLQWLEDGTGASAFELRGADRNNRTTSNNWAVPLMCNFNSPAQDKDPMGLFNGTGVTLTAGFWVLTAQATYVALAGNAVPTAGPAGSPSVFRAAVVTNDTDWLGGAAIKEEYSTYPVGAIHTLGAVRVGWFSAGTTVRLATDHSSANSHSLSSAVLSGFCVRGGV